jgi:hydrogenase-1 operon protein HyaF
LPGIASGLPDILQREIDMTAENAETALARNHTPPHPVFWMSQSKPGLSIEAEPGTSAQAILSEIEESVSRFAEAGEEASIDLRCLKAMPQEREILATLLGRGEVSAVVDVIGRSEIHETSIPCVWWVRHRNAEDDIVGDLIEITEIPEVMKGDRKAIARGLEALRIAKPFRMQKVRSVTTHSNER